MIRRLTKLVDGKRIEKVGILSLAAIIGLSSLGLPAYSAPQTNGKQVTKQGTRGVQPLSRQSRPALQQRIARVPKLEAFLSSVPRSFF